MPWSVNRAYSLNIDDAVEAKLLSTVQLPDLVNCTSLKLLMYCVKSPLTDKCLPLYCTANSCLMLIFLTYITVYIGEAKGIVVDCV